MRESLKNFAYLLALGAIVLVSAALALLLHRGCVQFMLS